MNETPDPAPATAEELPECFVIMPISGNELHDKEHYRTVYEEIFAPACKEAGFRPVRADYVDESNVIHADILRRLIESPMALCDLTSANPNVLLELGLRLAFDMPTALVQQADTTPLFDLSPLRTEDYRSSLNVLEVKEDIKLVATKLRKTYEAHQNGTLITLIRFLAMSKAQPQSSHDPSSTEVIRVLTSEFEQLRSDLAQVRAIARDGEPVYPEHEIAQALSVFERYAYQFMWAEVAACSAEFREGPFSEYIRNQIEGSFGRIQEQLSAEFETVPVRAIQRRLFDIRGRAAKVVREKNDEILRRRAEDQIKEVNAKLEAGANQPPPQTP